jgi:hypothetical protein
MLEPIRYGVVDSVHSKAGWGVSYICNQLQIPCTVFYPHMKAEEEGYLRPFQKKCREFGAELIPIPATKSSVLFYKARRIFNEKYPQGYLFPNGLKLEETIMATSMETRCHTPSDLITKDATWVISVSSGTIAAGVARGLDYLSFPGSLILHMGFSRAPKQLEEHIYSWCVNSRFKLKIVDEGYEYKDFVTVDVPFPCNPYYDRKAWKWLTENIDKLTDPIVFWNIGE